jgi:murein DD-endopeptidase MepM/ murein hydrolase activator NlpD
VSLFDNRGAALWARAIHTFRTRPVELSRAIRARIADSSASLPRDVSQWSREHWLLAGCSATLCTLVIAIAPGFARALSDAEVPRAVVTLALPDTGVGVHEPDGAHDTWTTVTIRSGQTLGQLFAELGLSATDMHRLLAHPGAKGPLTLIRSGQEFAFNIPEAGTLRAIRFDKDETQRVELALADGRVTETRLPREIQRRVLTARGEIRHSLYGAAEDAGVGASTINELANVFEHDIDFSRDLRVGDRFEVIYEEVWRDGERLRDGGIVAASFINRDKRYTAFRFERNGKAEYFDGEGRPLKKGFLRMPIEFARISSRFNPNRRHPVLGITRAHKGVDYAANTGTPIRAAGDGRISFAGWQNGYGRTIIIDHGRGYTTLYGHMSRLGSYRTGQRVSQGNVIGYVGATGLASGPHLHYEFRMAGVHRDPLKVTFPKPEPLPAAELARFRLHTSPVLAQLDLLAGRQYAAAGN